MSLFNVQQFKNRTVKFTAVLIPLFLFGYLLLPGKQGYNYTMFLNDPELGILSTILAFLFMVWYLHALYVIGIRRIVKRKLNREIFIVCSLMILCIFTPYQDDGSWISSLHVLLAYASFIGYNILILEVFIADPLFTKFYIPGCITAGMIVLLSGAITGIAEALYGSVTAVLLALRYPKK